MSTRTQAVAELTTGPILALNVQNSCAALSISKPTFYKLVEAGRLRTVRVGSRRLVPITELERFLADETAAV